jgi:ankyrin repeat domain-containing protein 50
MEICNSVYDTDTAYLEEMVDGITPLMEASYLGHIGVVKVLVEYGADICAVGIKGFSALYYAVRQGNFEVASFLIEQGLSVDEEDYGRETPLYDCIQARLRGSVEFLLDKGAKVNIRNREGTSPLHLAIYHGDIDIMRLLINAGADMNRTGKYGCSSLHLTLNYDSYYCYRIIEFLTYRGADTEALDKNGDTALEHAMKMGNRVLAELLIVAGANKEVLFDKEGKSRTFDVYPT